jgi:DNA-binding response OmpR family regulator
MSVPVIAVIEDDLSIVQLLDDLLCDAGYRVISYTQGRDAHQFILRTMPDLLILDWWLEDPAAGGMVLGLLERDPRTQQIPVIVCSAHIMALRQQADLLRARGHRILPKPFHYQELLACVQDALGATQPT